jgi:hypothetical protein
MQRPLRLEVHRELAVRFIEIVEVDHEIGAVDIVCDATWFLGVRRRGGEDRPQVAIMWAWRWSSSAPISRPPPCMKCWTALSAYCLDV